MKRRFSVLLFLLLSSVFAEETLQTRAENGDPQAMFELADSCFYGNENTLRNYTLAAYWYRKAAENGIASAMFNYGICLERGLGVKKDLHEAFAWYRKAADAGSKYGKLNAALMLLHGIPPDEERKKEALKPSPEAAKAEIRHLADEDFLPAQIVWAEQLLLKKKDAESGREAAELLQKLYKNGNRNPRVLCMLADCFYGGIGVKKNTAEMVRLLHEAADAGDAEAMGKLAYCYEYGRGTEIDDKKAGELYRKSAEGGNAMSQYKIAERLFMAEKIEEAMKWYQKAAENGNPQANFKLGTFYLEGFGTFVKKDERKAAQHFFEAASMNFAPAQYNLAILFETGGAGLKKDDAAAAYWFLCAAENGDAAAARCVGLRYLEGRTFTRSVSKGESWLIKAAQLGDSEAVRILRSRGLGTY